MLYYYRQHICTGILIIFLLICMQVILGYLENMQRKEGSPHRQAYHPLAVVLAPLTWPLFLIRALMGFALRAVLLVPLFLTFVLLLIVVRVPRSSRAKVETIQVDSYRPGLGERLLRLNTDLIRGIFGESVVSQKT